MSLQNITFSADKSKITAGRERARKEGTTLQHAFRTWLETYAKEEKEVEARVQAYRELRKRLSYVDPGPKASREELNAR